MTRLLIVDDEANIRTMIRKYAAERAFARFLQERGVLYFTGQKRMARNVLRGVLAFYAANPYGIAHAIVATLKRDAAACFRAVARGDWRGFASALNAYWRLFELAKPRLF